MNSPNRNLLVLMRYEFMTEQAIEKEIECLNRLLRKSESTDQFCKANELVDRNRITVNRTKILKETRYRRLRPFRFLINKN